MKVATKLRKSICLESSKNGNQPSHLHCLLFLLEESEPMQDAEWLNLFLVASKPPETLGLAFEECSRKHRH